MSSHSRLSSLPSSPSGERRRPHRESPSRRSRPLDIEARSNNYASQSSPSPRRTNDQAPGDPVPSPNSPRTEGEAMLMAPQYPDLSRKRSLIRPERSRIDRDHPNYYYRQHAQNMATFPSTTGNDPLMDDHDEDGMTLISDETDMRSVGATDSNLAASTFPIESKKLRKKYVVDGDSDRLQKKLSRQETKLLEAEDRKRDRLRQKELDAARPPSLWLAYCHLVTFWCPDALLRCFGKPQKAQQRAWREKIGLISVIILVCTFVGYLTFGFTQTVCPNGGGVRLRVNSVDSGYLIIHGQAYDLSRSQHPYALGVPAGSNVLYDLPQKHGGQDASFLFQNVNGNCKGLITAANNSDVPTNSDGDLAWYFPCNLYNQDGSSPPDLNVPYYLGYRCHLSDNARQFYYGLTSSSAVYFTWDDVKNTSRNLAVWGGDVIDLDLLEWFNPAQVTVPAEFKAIRENPSVRGTDLTLAMSTGMERQMAQCFTEIIKVGSIDTATIGCIASKVVLYVSLAFILSIVISKFLLALTFHWFLSRRFGAAKVSQNSRRRNKEIEDWADDIYRAPPKIHDTAPALYEQGSRRSFMPTTSRFTSPYADARSTNKRPQPTTMSSQSTTSRLLPPNPAFASEMSYPPNNRDSRSSLMLSEKTDARYSSMADLDATGPAGFIHDAVVPQPPPEWQPFGYPLAHAICLVTAYSEGYDGLRSTLDSIAVTDYPNSHKIIMIICDGVIRGKGEEYTTPDICLGMMRDHATLPDEVQAFSYVAVSSGSKRHNMAKIYAGFYDYGDDSIIPRERQVRVPMLVVVKCGTPDEAAKSKPGNRGKRDSQVMLMGFLQKVMFDERMTELEYEMFNGIWKITGISPDFYEVVLMVDADTKVFPDCLTHMVSAMVQDPEIMGLCGETKIANKNVSWITRIQVFEYFISHHLAKSFESVFGGVTCLPGCFSMYRIKAPKGGQNYWVPILANPDIVEHYSENVVDTLHKKNLLLLGEDRYLSTLMLKTFPKRKQVFVPQAVCKTICPETFSVLLSQRRRWINSTIHNLMELVLVRDLCGTFCFSMQFVVFIELVGTLVLPAAIAFTIYLIIISVKAAITHSPIPVIPLILLALILGLPAPLIVLTAHRWSYVMWMLIYLLSLPIWNFVLPTYAYWKFDDFSWGDTRKTMGEKTKKAGLEYEGEFDSSKITMKRWGDFEQERRLRGQASSWPQQLTTLGGYPQSEHYQSRASYHDL